MRPGDILARSTRLTRIQHLLHRNPRGLTARELADLCRVSVRSIQRDFLSLHDLQIPVTQQGCRYAILGGYLLPPVSFSLYEAMALFLASRLVLRQIDENNPHMAAALGKIAPMNRGRRSWPGASRMPSGPFKRRPPTLASSPSSRTSPSPPMNRGAGSG